MHERDQPVPAATDEVAILDPATPSLDIPPEEDAELEEMLIGEISIDGMCGVY